MLMIIHEWKILIKKLPRIQATLGCKNLYLLLLKAILGMDNINSSWILKYEKSQSSKQMPFESWIFLIPNFTYN